MLVSQENFQQVLDDISLETFIAIDVGFIGEDAYKDAVLSSVVMVTEKGTYYFIFTDDTNSLPKGLIKDLAVVLENEYTTKVFSEPKFDMKLFLNEGVRVSGPIFDYLALVRLVDNNRIIYDTKDAELVFAESRVALTILKERDKQNLPNEKGLMDVVKNESRLVETLFRMENRGVEIDVEYCKEAVTYYKSKIDECCAKFLEITGKKLVKGPKVLLQVFGSTETISYSEKGNPIFDSSTLKGFSHPAAAVMLGYSESKKQLDYFENLLYFADNCHVVHSQFCQAGTVTGRFSSKNPNFQNLTNTDKYEESSSSSVFQVRRALKTRPGYFFVMLDYSQVEYRVMLDMARANKLIDEILNGLDVHEATAKLASVSRKQAKTCIARGSLVLTHRGLVPIEDVLLTDRLWDGVEWVEHSGVIYQGLKNTLVCDGLEATEEHYVFTDKGWKISFGDYTKEPNIGRLMVSENSGDAVRVFGNDFRNFSEKKVKKQLLSLRKVLLFSLQKNIVSLFSEYNKRFNNKLSLYKKQRQKMAEGGPAGYSLVKTKIFCRAMEVQKQSLKKLQELRWSWYPIKDLKESMDSIFCHKILYAGNFVVRDRPNQQRQSLRARKFAVSHSIRKFEKQKNKQGFSVQWTKHILRGCVGETERRLSKFLSKQKNNIQAGVAPNTDRRHFEQKTKRPVYDILNAGPRHRFTVSGKLVANCNFLTLYGGGIAKLAESLFPTVGTLEHLKVLWRVHNNMSLTPAEEKLAMAITCAMWDKNIPHLIEAKRIQDAVFGAAPEIKDFIKSVMKTVSDRRKHQNQGFVKNWLGRRYFFSSEKNGSFDYKAPNHLIQGSCADILKVAMNQVDELLLNYRTKLLLTIHDELVLEVYFGEEFLVGKVKNIMENVYPFNRLPLPVDVEYSYKNLADKSPWVWQPLQNGSESRDNIEDAGFGKAEILAPELGL